MKLAFQAHTPTLATLLLALASFASAGCSDSGDATDTSAVVKNYASNVAANYEDTLAGAKKLDAAVHAFSDAPSAALLEKARQAWLAAREPYALSEAYRFYQGPIDNDDGDDHIPAGPEPLINSWPLDESYIDYVVDGDGKVVSGGIINLPDEFPTVDAKVLSDANAKVSETTISTGYHAIEFLLWGQDFSADGPGARPYTDYVTGTGGSAENQARRAEYLLTLSDLLVNELSSVSTAWLDGEADFRADFLALPPEQALGKIMLGMGSLSGAELSGERMQVAYDNKDQEDEHSCFSDNTLTDLHDNATSVKDVLLGSYGGSDGPGIDDLVQTKDPALAKQLRDQIQSAIDAIDAVDGPFDQAIMGEDDTANRQHILAAIEALQGFTETLVAAAHTLGIDLKFE